MQALLAPLLLVGATVGVLAPFLSALGSAWAAMAGFVGLVLLGHRERLVVGAAFAGSVLPYTVYAFAATDKGNVGAAFHTDGERPGDAVAEWHHRVTQLTVAAKAAVAQRYGRAPTRTYVTGISNGGYLARWQLENRGWLYDGGVDWEGTLFTADGPNLFTFLPPALRHYPSAAAGDEAHLGVFLANLAYLADHRGDYETARRLGRDALRLCWSLGRRMMAAWTVSELAGPELGLGRPEHGALLVGAADEALRVLGVNRHPGDVPEHERVVAGLRAAIGDDIWRARHVEGARLSLDEAVALALSGPAPPDRGRGAVRRGRSTGRAERAR